MEMKFKRSNRLTVRIGKAVIVSGLAFSACIAAQPPHGKGEHHPDAAAYAEEYRVPVSEAEQRLSREQDIAHLEQRLRRDAPETFAGLYIEHQPQYRVVVKFTSDPKGQLARYTNDPLFVADYAPRSLELLMATLDELTDQLADLDVEFETGLDIKTSEINLSVRDPQFVSQRLPGLLAVAGFIKLHRTTGFVEPTAITGGNRLDGPTRKCTSGFNVVNSAGELGLVTAGHCENSLTYVSSRSRNLVFQTQRDRGSHDVQWHKQPSSGTPQTQSNLIKLIRGPQNTRRITSETPLSQLPLGAQVCKSGISGYYRCGVVADKHARTNYKGVIGEYVRAHNANNVPLSVGGDSGGPVFGGNSAYGIIHGRGFKGTSTHNDLYFMPIQRLSVLDISVVTKRFKINRIPNVTGPQGQNIPAKVYYAGYTHFPVKRETKIISCAAGWSCSDYNGTYTDNTSSPLTFNFRCTNSTPLPTATFRWRTTLTGADGVVTNAIEHTSTCTTPTTSNLSSHPGTGKPTIRIVP